MAGRMKQLQLNMYLRRHPNKKRKNVTDTAKKERDRGMMEKEITIIGAKEPVASNAKLKEVHMAETETAPVIPDVQDDYLIAQIDEFRVKAQQLQQLLHTKEEKAKELQQVVNERASKAAELQQIVSERQKKADGITLEVSRQIDGLVDKVDSKMDEIEQSFEERCKKSEEEAERRLETTNKAISDMTEQFAEVKLVSEKIDTVKAELSDKIHTESVQSYRNTQELIKGIDERLDKVDVIEQGVHSVRKMTVAVIAITVIDLIGIAAAVVISLGIF